MARQERPIIFRNIGPGRKRKIQPTEGLLDTLICKFQPQHNETIKSLQFHKLVREINKNAEEWMGRHWLAAVECNYKEIDRALKEQFIHSLNNNEMLA